MGLDGLRLTAHGSRLTAHARTGFNGYVGLRRAGTADGEVLPVFNGTVPSPPTVKYAARGQTAGKRRGLG